MIDKFQHIAWNIRFLRIPAAIVGLISVAVIAATLIFFGPQVGDQWLILCFLGLLWAISTYAFIVNFQAVPEKANQTMGFFRRFKRNLHRGWYWLIGLTFLGMTVGVIYVSLRMISVWMKN